MPLTNTLVPENGPEVTDVQFYPVPVFFFRVIIGNSEGVFTEVSGLNNDVEVIEYRHGMSRGTVFKMPGLSNTSDISLKKGVFKTDLELYEWFATNNLHTVQRRNITIQLLDETDAAVMTWSVLNAFAKTFTGPDLNASSSEMSIESVELAHEGLTII